MTNECHCMSIGLFMSNKPEAVTSLNIQMWMCLYDDGNPVKMAENYVINISTTQSPVSAIGSMYPKMPPTHTHSLLKERPLNQGCTYRQEEKCKNCHAAYSIV